MAETTDKNAPRNAPAEKVTSDKEKASNKTAADTKSTKKEVKTVTPYVAGDVAPYAEPLTMDQYEESKRKAAEANQKAEDAKNKKNESKS